MSLRAVLDRRRDERTELIARTRGFVDSIDPALGVRGAVVYGSVARGDFNLWSDVDLLVIATELPERFLDRLAALVRPPARVERVA